MIKYVILLAVILGIVFVANWMSTRSQKGKSGTAYVTADTTVHDVLALDEGMAEVLASHGMHCLGCPSAVSETLEQACTVHNLDLDEILFAVNDRMKRKNAENED